MKDQTTSKTVEFFSRLYRFTYHHGSMLLEIEVMQYKQNWLGKQRAEWKRVYFGHDIPITEAVKFFNEAKTNNR